MTLLNSPQLLLLQQLLGPDSPISERHQDAVRSALEIANRGASLLIAAKSAERVLAEQGAIISNASVRGRLQVAIHRIEGS